MASISKDANGNRTVQFVGVDKKRRSIRLGKMTHKNAETVKGHVEAIVGALKNKVAVDSDTAAWLGKQPPDQYAKYVAVGLAKPRVTEGANTLGGFIDAYIAKRTDVKPNTMKNLKQAKRHILAYFGADKPLVELNEGDADEFRLKLGEQLGENTLRRICGRARQFFKAAKKKHLIDVNPFGEMKGLKVGANEDRQHFITRDVADKVLEACPDAEWRVIFALARYGGLRCPSETLTLRWSDINWATERFTVHSPKTEHCEGHATRVVPLFPELRIHLEELWEQTAKGAVYVITRYRGENANLRTQLERIIDRAGVERWEKPFQNLRSTRETELAETFPIKTVCKWIGNSEAVAKKHYLQVTEAHFQQAVQKAVQSAAVTPSTARESETVLAGIPASDDSLRYCTSEPLPLRGVEVSPKPPIQCSNSQTGGADSGAVLTDRWDSLTADQRAAILAIVGG